MKEKICHRNEQTIRNLSNSHVYDISKTHESKSFIKVCKNALKTTQKIKTRNSTTEFPYNAKQKTSSSIIRSVIHPDMVHLRNQSLVFVISG